MAKSKNTNAEKIESENGDKEDIIQVQSIKQPHKTFTIDCNNMTIRKSDCGIMNQSGMRKQRNIAIDMVGGLYVNHPNIEMNKMMRKKLSRTIITIDLRN